MDEISVPADFNAKEFGFNLGRFREARNHRQKEFAEMIGISQRSLQAIEGGYGNVSLELAFKMSKVLSVPLTQLLRLSEGSIVNSFNNIEENATALANSHYSRNEADKEHILTLRERVTFLEKLVFETLGKH